jgi:hypothetical protein
MLVLLLVAGLWGKLLQKLWWWLVGWLVWSLLNAIVVIGLMVNGLDGWGYWND